LFREDHGVFVTVDLIAELAVIDPFDFFVEDAAEFPSPMPTTWRPISRPLSRTRAGGTVARRLSRQDAPGSQRAVDHIVGLNAGLQNLVRYVVRTVEPAWLRRKR